MGWPEKLPSGRYSAKYRDARGNKRSAGVFVRKAEATRAANAAEEKARKRSGPEIGRRLTWGEWKVTWLETRSVEASTARTDASRIKNYLEPQWGSVRLVAIGRNDVKRWAAAMRRDGAGASLVQRCVHLLSSSLNAAIDEELLETNPAYRIKLERGALAPERFLTVTEYDAVLAQLPSVHDQLVMKLLTHTGLRWGELAGLHWNRVDLARGQLQVVETWSETGRCMKAYPKGRRIRTVPIPAWLVEELKTLPVTIGGCGHRHAAGTCRSGLVLTTAHNNVLHHSKWSALWRTAVADAGIGVARIHDLRHTYASWLLQSGRVSLAEVGQLLGHVDPATTQKYAHLEKRAGTTILDALPAPRLPHGDAATGSGPS